MSIERLRALEKEIRKSGGPGCQYHADQLASIIAELGQEVGAVAVGEVVESEAVGRAISFPNGYSVTLDTLAIGTKIYAGSAPSGDEHMAMHWIDRYAAGIDDEPQIDLIRDALTSPAHTSEARDAAAKFVERVESVASFLVGYGEAAEVAASGLRGALFDYDAAMRQEAE